MLWTKWKWKQSLNKTKKGVKFVDFLNQINRQNSAYMNNLADRYASIQKCLP